MNGLPDERDLQARIDEVLARGRSGYDTTQSVSDLLETVHVYHAELEFQNDELRRTTERLQRSKDHFAELFNSSPVGYAFLDIDGRITETNRTFSRIVGRALGELKGVRFVELIEPASQDAYYFLDRAHGRNRDEQSGILRIDTPDGTVPVKCIVSARDEDDAVCRLTLIDMRKEEEDRLRREADAVRLSELSHELNARKTMLETVINAMPAAVFVKDARRRYIVGNTRFLDLLNQTEDSLVGKTAYDFLPRESAAKYDASDQALLGGLESTQEYETILTDSDDTPRDFVVFKSRYCDADGNAAGIVGVMLDVTRRKQLETDNRRLLQAVEQAAASVVITDIDGNILYVNPAFGRETGYSVEAALGQNPRILKSGEMPGQVYEEMWQSLKSAGAWRGELLNKRKDGTLYWEDAVITALRDAENNPVNYVAVKIDISARKAAEEKLHEANRQLEEAAVTARRLADAANDANRAKGTFLANMSHEIRTPMNAVMGFSRLLLSENLTPQSRELAGNIERAGRLLLSIINNILDFSKAESGKIELESIPFSFRALLDDIAIIVTPEAREKGLACSFNVAPDVAPTYLGDPVRIAQILVNLTGNAVKFTASGSVNIHIAHDGDSVACTVSDTGIGMPADKLGKIFEPFTQADASTTRRFGGTGLGLSICKQIVDLMGGTLTVESEPGNGTRFTALLPLRPADAAEVLPAAPKSRRMIDGIRIAVVDDNTINLKLADRFFSNAGAIVDCYDSSSAALYGMSGAMPDMIFVDLSMPDIDGRDLVRQLRRMKQFETVPIYALTAYESPQVRQECLDAGMDGLSPKPFDVDALIETVRVVVGASRLRHVLPKPIAFEDDVAGIDVADALHRMGDDRTILRRMFERIHTRYLSEHPPTQIRARFDADPGGAHMMLHNLRGLYGNIGARRLYAIVSRLDDIVSTPGASPSEPLWQEFVAAFEEMVGGIAEWLKRNPAIPGREER